MRLEKIKLSGFKSFVDPTVIPIQGNLTAIVGPNGCGKSNIIDAIRWVMGESSAKHLRGDSMADVIFNGSATRKPVSTASVELVFDNTEGKIGGEYAQYATIAIKRQVSRDGQSVYFLNGSKCRRKDITDIFLGTGLGSRSYAIIEQGTISRMVEAKPDDLRMHIEEAAGVSKYKERRSETEMRMRHTRENLERLNDLRDEVDKQIKHLQKQAEKAEKYTALKQQERQFRLELLAMRWNLYHASAEKIENTLKVVTDEHNTLYENLRHLTADLENKRSDYKIQQQQLSQIQSDYYNTAADVSNLDQAIRFNTTSHEETLQEITRSRQLSDQTEKEILEDIHALEKLRESITETEAILENALLTEHEAAEALKNYQQQKNDWSQAWESFRTDSAKSTEQAEIQKLTILQLTQTNQQLQIRLDKLSVEQRELLDNLSQQDIDSVNAEITLLEENKTESELTLQQYKEKIQHGRQQINELTVNLNRYRTDAQQISGKITSLELLQQHAMGKDNKHLIIWLTERGLDQNRRLAEILTVENGWENAVETVLADKLEAICTEDADFCLGHLSELHDSSITLFEQRSYSDYSLNQRSALLDKVKAPWDLVSLLAGVYCADSISDARHIASQLQNHESVITPDGAWLGPGWLTIKKEKDTKIGILQRETTLRALKQQQLDINAAIEQHESDLHHAEQVLKKLETDRENLQHQYNQINSELSRKQSQASAINARIEQHNRRLTQIEQELQHILDEISDNNEQLLFSKTLLTSLETDLKVHENLKLDLEQQNETLLNDLQHGESTLHEARQHVYTIKTRLESLRSTQNITEKQIERLQQQHDHALMRIQELETKLEQSLAPIENERKQLGILIGEKELLESQLKDQRKILDTTESQINALAEDQTRCERNLELQRGKLDQLRLDLQESKVRQQSVDEQLSEIDADVNDVLANMPEDANEPVWKRNVDELASQIERLGTINLTAIEEFQVQSERMAFLNEQHADLSEALSTLDQAIHQIDKESKLRFKETFDKINTGLQEKFPKLFGGGQAYLELTEDDLLESGVNIIARPPGKRNSSIHLLSGGEKALTAVALVFSIFELNPAPFCLLDEVDAPLDDANVGRFSQMVENMSESVQFLYISHNKVTMEIAKQLAGVTMKEPGVSRMVAVDIEEAVSLAES
jgi:chromosome segregation protein